MNHCQFLSGYYPDCLCVSWGLTKRDKFFLLLCQREGEATFHQEREREENLHQGKSKKSCLLLEKSQDKEK